MLPGKEKEEEKEEEEESPLLRETHKKQKRKGEGMSSMLTESNAAKVTAVAAERPGFSRTCSLLRRYLKEKGSLDDLNLNFNLKLNFVDASSSSPDPGRSDVSDPFSARTMNLFPEYKLNSSRDAGKDPEMAPMTIFYAGKVIVCDDFPAEKAKEAMIIANRASIPGSVEPKPAHPVPPPPPTKSGSCDLPIARRASLHRFLEKRRDRLMARAPYQKEEGNGQAPAKTKSWLGQAARTAVVDGE